jgi:uncharacterized membrane protein
MAIYGCGEIIMIVGCWERREPASYWQQPEGGRQEMTPLILIEQGAVVKEWMTFVSEYAVLIINAMALLIIVVGTIEMSVKCLRAIFAPSATGREIRDGYLHYARWLIAGLTFQLASDIIASALAPSWDDIGRLAAIAVIRTFLNYFLERDVLEARKLQHEGERNSSQVER